MKNKFNPLCNDLRKRAYSTITRVMERFTNDTVGVLPQTTFAQRVTTHLCLPKSALRALDSDCHYDVKMSWAALPWLAVTQELV